MFTITKQIDGKFKITYPNKRGDKKETVTDLTIEQCHEAVNHHYSVGPRATQHARHGIDHCPLCKGDVAGRPFLSLVGVDAD